MIGRMRHRLMVQTEIDTEDGGGGFARTWHDLGFIFAKVEQLSGADMPEAGGLLTKKRYRITSRPRRDVAIVPGMRLMKAGTAYKIISVTDRDETQTFIEIIAETLP